MSAAKTHFVKVFSPPWYRGGGGKTVIGDGNLLWATFMLLMTAG
ncbi:MAG: hypothetical protein CM1200mP28_06900 [Deltaproteobacteria bacterium]|nr:MAG: hypothetical protein CM1200mP28_06900 [Deltaproteobacteria bacterium]